MASSSPKRLVAGGKVPKGLSKTMAKRKAKAKKNPCIGLHFHAKDADELLEAAEKSGKRQTKKNPKRKSARKKRNPIEVESFDSEEYTERVKDMTSRDMIDEMEGFEAKGEPISRMDKEKLYIISQEMMDRAMVKLGRPREMIERPKGNPKKKGRGHPQGVIAEGVEEWEDLQDEEREEKRTQAWVEFVDRLGAKFDPPLKDGESAAARFSGRWPHDVYDPYTVDYWPWAEPKGNPKKKAKRKATKKKTLGGRAKRAGRKIEKRGKVLAVDAERGAEKAGRKLKKFGKTKEGYSVAGAGLGAILLGPIGAVAGAVGGQKLYENPGAMMNPTALNEMLRMRLPEMSDKEVVDVYEQYYTMYTKSPRPEMDYGEEGVELIRSVIKDTSDEIRRRDLKSNPKKKGSRKKTSKLKTKAKKAGRKAKKFAKTKEGYGALGAGAGALLLGPIGAVAGAIGGTELHGNPPINLGASSQELGEALAREFVRQKGGDAQDSVDIQWAFERFAGKRGISYDTVGDRHFPPEAPMIMAAARNYLETEEGIMWAGEVISVFPDRHDKPGKKSKNPRKKKTGSKLKKKAKKAGRKAKKFAKTKEGYGALGAGAGALLLGPIGAVAGAVGGSKLHGNPTTRKRKGYTIIVDGDGTEYGYYASHPKHYPLENFGYSSEAKAFGAANRDIDKTQGLRLTRELLDNPNLRMNPFEEDAIEYDFGIEDETGQQVAPEDLKAHHKRVRDLGRKIGEEFVSEDGFVNDRGTDIKDAISVFMASKFRIDMGPSEGWAGDPSYANQVRNSVRHYLRKEGYTGSTVEQMFGANGGRSRPSPSHSGIRRRPAQSTTAPAKKKGFLGFLPGFSYSPGKSSEDNPTRRRKNPTPSQHHAMGDRKWNMFESAWDSFSISNSPEDLLGAYTAVVEAELHYAHAGVENDDGRGYGPAGAEAEGIRKQINERLEG